MPTSRHRKRKRQRSQSRVHPYEAIIRGVRDEEALQPWFERAMWSFHRGPFPPQDDELLQNAAAARAFEWFLFDLRLPDSGLTPAEWWIDAQTERHRWSAAVQERYRRFTRGQYGLFEVRRAPLPVLFLEELATGREVHAVNTEAWLVPEEGDVLAARLFPLEDDRLAVGSPPILELSPGSDLIVEEDRRLVEGCAGADALDVEVLFGASVGWMANAIGAGHAFAKLSDHFFSLISDGSMRAETIRRELRASGDPGMLIADVLCELSPLTKEEAPIFGALVGALWLDLRFEQGGLEPKTLSGEWQAMLGRVAPAGDASRVQAPLESVDDEVFRLSEHEAARLRAIPQAPGVEWVGSRVRMPTSVYEAGKLPYYPDGIFWVERDSGVIAGATVVHPEEPTSILVRSLADAMLEPLPPGRPSRPSRVSIGGRTLAANLSPALAPLGISVGVRYLDPSLGRALSGIERQAASEQAEGGTEGFIAAASGGYLNLPGGTPEGVARFFDAAARFYRAAPWTLLADDRWIEVEVPGITSTGVRSAAAGTLHATAVIMGNGGQTFGLALYFDDDDLDTLVRGAPPASSLEFDTLAVTFDTERETKSDLVREARKHRWPIAGRRAYPTGLRTMPDAPPRLIAGGELDLACAALDAVREFVSRHDTVLRDPTVRCTDRIDVPDLGTLTLTLEPEMFAEAE